MKKNLLMFFALVGSAWASGVTFTDLTQDETISSISFTASTGLFTGDITSYEGTESGKGSKGAITFALDWTAATALTSNTCLLTVNYGNSLTNNTGIYFASDDNSIRAWYNNATDNGGNIADTTEVLSSKQTINGKDYVILTFRYDDIGASNDTKGVSLFNSTDEVFEYWSLGSSGFDEATSIYVNTSLISAVSIRTGVIDDTTAKAAVSELAGVIAVPEPASAAMGLLGMLGLLSRRRR
ncbi:MAG: PEP-CTERM sorting domain-containing protein [Akkermansia sp.]